MDYDLISIKMEKQLKSHLEELLQTKLIGKLLNLANIDDNSNSIKTIIEGQGFKICSELSPRIYNICMEVVETLEFKDDVYFFIVNSADVNAYAIPKSENNDTNLIIINSAMIDRFDDDELKFVIGHELGHLISGYSQLSDVINFLFNDDDRTPIIYTNKIRLWKQLAELTGDESLSKG